MNEREDGETGVCTGGDDERWGDMLANCAWVKDRPDCDKNEDVRPMEVLGRDMSGAGCTPGGVDRRREVEGEDDIGGCIEWPDSRRAVTAAPLTLDGVTPPGEGGPCKYQQLSRWYSFAQVLTLGASLPLPLIRGAAKGSPSPNAPHRDPADPLPTLVPTPDATLLPVGRPELNAAPALPND